MVMISLSVRVSAEPERMRYILAGERPSAEATAVLLSPFRNLAALYASRCLMTEAYRRSSSDLDMRGIILFPFRVRALSEDLTARF